jgi:hypothetical protein
MRKKSLLAVVVCTAALAGASASAAFAGEVKGPPGTPSTEGPPPTPPIPPDSGATAAPEHANSICAFSGLNDLRVGQGPTDFIVQSPGQDVRNGGPPGIPGLACRGGSNDDARGTPPFK